MAAFFADREALVAIIADPRLDLYAKIPHGDGQTYLRELVLVADHSAYHISHPRAIVRELGKLNEWDGNAGDR